MTPATNTAWAFRRYYFGGFPSGVVADYRNSPGSVPLPIPRLGLRRKFYFGCVIDDLMGEVITGDITFLLEGVEQMVIPFEFIGGQFGQLAVTGSTFSSVLPAWNVTGRVINGHAGRDVSDSVALLTQPALPSVVRTMFLNIDSTPIPAMGQYCLDMSPTEFEIEADTLRVRVGQFTGAGVGDSGRCFFGIAYGCISY